MRPRQPTEGLEPRVEGRGPAPQLLSPALRPFGKPMKDEEIEQLDWVSGQREGNSPLPKEVLLC